MFFKADYTIDKIMGFLLIQKLIIQNEYFLVSFDYNGYIMMYYWLFIVLFDVRPNSMEKSLIDPISVTLGCELMQNFLSGDEIYLVLVLIKII